MSSSEYDGAGVSPQTFQEIIRERKAEVKEKTQLKRIQDLKRIQEMKSKEGRNPLDIFPKEIWSLILQELSSEDRGKMWELHDVFRDIMHKSHVRDNLFPQILDKVDTTGFWRVSNPIADSDDDEEDDEVQCSKNLLANFLELRKVSKSFRKEINRFTEEEFRKSLWQRRQGQNTTMPRKTTWFEFEEPLEKPDERLVNIAEYLESNTKTTTTPRIFSRSLTITIVIGSQGVDDNVLRQFEIFCSKIMLFLEHFGNQIWHLELEVSEQDYDNAQNRDNEANKLHIPFNLWTSLMPNLKWILFCHVEGREPSTCFDLQDFKTQPKLQSLQRIDIDLYPRDDEVSSMVQSLLEGQPHIKVLNLYWKGTTPITLTSIESLEAISVDLRGNFYRMQKAVKFNWPLKRMSLFLNMQNDSIIPVFQFVQKFPSLEKLALLIKDVTIGGGIDFLRLPQLKDFEMKITNPKLIEDAPFHFFFSLQFLLYSKGLKKLKLNCVSRETDKLKERLQKKEYPGNMFLLDLGSGWDNLVDSNIWQVFRHLECVKVLEGVVNDQNVVKVNAKKYCKGSLVESHSHVGPIDNGLN